MLRPRLPPLAVAFAAGICLAGVAGDFARAPLPWASLAVALALSATVARRRIGVWWLAAAVAAGGATAAWDRASRCAATLPASIAADDRGVDELAGTVVGSVDDLGGRRRFRLALVASGGAVVEVSVRGGPAVLPGDRVRLVARVRTPRGYRVPGAVDRAAVVARRGGQWVATARPEDVRVVGASWSPWRGPARAQRALSAAIDRRGGDATGRAIVRAMIAGDRGGVDTATADRFRAAGIAHILAVSGLHLAATALLVFAGLRRLWAAAPALAARADPTRVAALCALPAAVAYTAVTGARVSTLRALVVVACVLGGAALRRRARLLDSLGAAALLILAASPAALFDPSFQLSFAATAALACVAVSGNRVTSLVRATLWVSLAVAPITAFAFGAVQTGGIAANLVAVPLAELVILPLGLAGAALSTVWKAGGGALLDLAVAAATLVDRIAGAVAEVFPVLRVAPLTLFELVAAGAVVALLLRRTRAAAIAAIVPAAALAISYAWPRAPDGVAIAFLDVGQGDAAVVELPDGEVWLVDTGGLGYAPEGAGDPLDAMAAPGEHSVARYLAHRRIDRVDVVVLSHPHADHYAGLRAIAAAVDIGEVWIPRGADYAGAVDGLRVVHPPLGAARARAGATLDVLAPRYESADAERDPVHGANDNSLVVAVRYAGRRVLFTGDLEAEGEAMLVAAVPDLAADVVKAPHHGSRTSSSPALVAATHPAWVAISCGVANRFEFPAPEVVARWQAAGARVLRTDQRGAIRVRIAPSGDLSVSTFD
jgi:competence protein ComEC